MTKMLTRFWLNHHSFDDAVNSGDGMFLTIITTYSGDVKDCNMMGISIKVGKVGEFNDCCDKYEVVDSESGSNWKKFADLTYNNGRLRVASKGEKFSMNCFLLPH